MNTIYPSRLLKLALIADALVSGCVAALQLAASGWLSELLMLPRVLLFETGVFLVGYAILLLVLTCIDKLWTVIIGAVVVGNVGWAVGCIGLLAGVLSPNALGVAFMLVQIVSVLIFATLEYFGLRASQPAGGPATETSH